MLDNIWNTTDKGERTKVPLYKNLVLSGLLYGCETWKLTKIGEEDWHPSGPVPQKNSQDKMAITYPEHDSSGVGKGKQTSVEKWGEGDGTWSVSCDGTRLDEEEGSNNFSDIKRSLKFF